MGEVEQGIRDLLTRYKDLSDENMRLWAIIKLASDQDQGCGGGLSPERILHSMQVILRQEIIAQEEQENG
jgi:hypothetical protein